MRSVVFFPYHRQMTGRMIISFDGWRVNLSSGEKKAGCAALDQALTDHSLTLLWMRFDPRMDPLRDEACFTQIRDRIYGK